MNRGDAKSSLDNVIIRASAGTGKTFQLSNRFLELLFRGVSAERILATTFTRKAAGEILDRVILRLAAAALDDTERRELQGFLQLTSLPAAECMAVLCETLRNLHRLRISTLDSFFAHLARSFSLELGLPPSWQIVDPVEETGLRDEAIEMVLRQEKTADLLSLTHLLSKGETHRSVSGLIQTTIADLYNLYLETEPRAWRQIPQHKPLTDERLQELLESLREIEVGGKRLVNARNADYDLASRGEWEGFVARGLAKKVVLGELLYYGKPLPADLVAVYEPLVQHAKANIVGRIARQTEGSHELLKKFDGCFRLRKQERRVLRFADVTQELAAHLRKPDEDGPSSAFAAACAYRLDGSLQHLLLDEFQDTAPVQWRVLRPFAEEVNGEGPGSFLCVGDTKQAIYGWRGGVAEIFDAVGRELPGLTQQQLNSSYRSAPPVIDAVNGVFGNLTRHPHLEQAAPAIEAWQKAFPHHTTERSDLAGYVALQTAPSGAEGQPPHAPTLAYTAGLVAQLHQQRPKNTIGVLVRRNETVGKLIYALRRKGVQASEEGGNPLTDSLAVQLILSLLRLGDHPGDTAASFHVLHSPLGKALSADDQDLRLASWRISRRVRRSLMDTGYGPAVARWAKTLVPFCSSRENSRLEQLIERAYTYQSKATLRADDFVDLVEKERIADPASACVRVMTIHQAKGLQFDVVVLPELDASLTGQPDSFAVHRRDPAGPVDRVCRHVNRNLQRLLPPAFQEMFEGTTDREVTESLCVLYVALTRAIHELRMVIAASPDNEKKPPRTFAGLLRTSLVGTDLAAPSTTLYQHGQYEWPSAASEAAPPSERVEPTSIPAIISLAPSDGVRRRGVPRSSPSGMEGGPRIQLADVLRPRNETALIRGTLIHAWFEQIEWLDQTLPSSDTLRRVAEDAMQRANAPTGDVDALLDDFAAMIAKPAVQATLRRSAYAKLDSLGIALPPQTTTRRLTVQNERSFAIKLDGEVLNGSIDRLVLIYDGEQLVAADVIDFKTDVIASKEDPLFEARLEHYRPQIQAYCRAVRKMTGLEAPCVAARLLFVGPGIVAPIAATDA